MFVLNIKSEREKIEQIQNKFEAEIQNLNRTNDLICEKTTALAKFYRQNCLVDKSKSDAVQILLNYQIQKAKYEYRTNDVKNLEQELNEL